MNTMESVLSTFEFLKGIRPGMIAKMAEFAALERYAAGEYLFRQGEKAERFYLVKSGKIEVELFSATGGPVVVQTVEPGGALGWSWLTPPYRWHFDARAEEPVEVVALDARDLHGEFELDHDFGYEMLKRFIVIITERLESERIKLVSLCGAHT